MWVGGVEVWGIDVWCCLWVGLGLVDVFGICWLVVGDWMLMWGGVLMLVWLCGFLRFRYDSSVRHKAGVCVVTVGDLIYMVWVYIGGLLSNVWGIYVWWHGSLFCGWVCVY